MLSRGYKHVAKPGLRSLKGIPASAIDKHTHTEFSSQWVTFSAELHSHGNALGPLHGHFRFQGSSSVKRKL